MTVISLIILAIVSGVFGRLGGAAKSGQWYDFLCNTKARDVVCSIIVVLAWILISGFDPSYWLVYLIVFGLHWLAFSTYWDWLFNFDNLGYSGFFVGICSMPFIFIIPDAWWILLLRAFLLGTIWYLLNKYLPSKVLLWNRDVAEEFLRYKSVII